MSAAACQLARNSRAACGTPACENTRFAARGSMIPIAALVRQAKAVAQLVNERDDHLKSKPLFDELYVHNTKVVKSKLKSKHWV
jgi:hypothetical protein